MVFKKTTKFQKKVIGIGIIFLLLITVSVRGDIIQHQWPDIPESSEFRVWVNGKAMVTGLAGNKMWRYSFCAFDFNEPVTVRVRSTRSIKWLDVLPSILKIEHKTIDDHTVEFTLAEPKKITVIVNNDTTRALHLLTNYPETNRPDPEDEQVLFYKGGKTYDIGILDLKNNQTLYLESGARLKGMVRIRDASNVTIMGRGMIDGTDNRSEGNGRFGNEPWRLIYMEKGSDIKIEGITLYKSLKWTLHAY
ncbi:MAG: hypothetical protein ACYSOD_01045, partial [Planctomycetota bacterium]